MTDAASDNERPLIAHLLELRSRLLRGAVGPERAVVVVTHDLDVAAACDQRWHLMDGALVPHD